MDGEVSDRLEAVTCILINFTYLVVISRVCTSSAATTNELLSIKTKGEGRRHQHERNVAPWMLCSAAVVVLAHQCTDTTGSVRWDYWNVGWWVDGLELGLSLPYLH